MVARVEVMEPDATALIVGGTVSTLLTVTWTLAEVPTLPDGSLAWAVIVWVPLVAVVVSQAVWYGVAVSGAPMVEPSTRNCTTLTLVLSLAVAESVTEPDSVAPLAGAVTLTVGGVVSIGPLRSTRYADIGELLHVLPVVQV